MEQGQELFEIKNIIRRRKWSLIIPFVSIVLVTAIICMVLPDKYISTATILIRNQQVPPTLVASTVTSYAEQRIQTITQEVMSRARILNLVKKYDLLPEDRDKLTTEEIVEIIRDRITLEPINAEVNKETSSRPVMLTIAFTLSYEDEDPRKAQLVTNEIASYYMEKNLESREEFARQTTKFLEEQSKKVKARIDKLEAELAEFRKEHIDELPEFTNLNMQKLEKLNADISNLNMQIRSLEEQRASLRNQLASLDPYSGSNERVLSPSERLQQARLEEAQLMARYSPKHPLVLAKKREIALLEKQVAGDAGNLAELKAREKELELKLSDLKSKYSDEHPSVKALRREIKEIKEQIAQASQEEAPASSKERVDATNPAYLSIKSDLDRINVSLASLRSEKARIEEQLKNVYGKLQAMPEVAKRYNELEMDYQNAKAHYQELQRKLLTAQVSQGMEEDKLGETFQIVEPAFLPEKPSKPNRLAIMIIGIVLGAGFSVGFTAIREFSDRAVRDINGLENASGTKVLAVISHVASPGEAQKRKKKRMIAAGAALGGLAALALIIHLFVMDFSILIERVIRFIQTRFI